MLQSTASYQSSSEAKRRKLRKGTHSCWECKRRKMKCIFDLQADVENCKGCRRRGSQCVSQEVPEEEISVSMDRTHKMSDSMGRIRDLRGGSSNTECAGTVASTPSDGGRREGQGDSPLTPVSIRPELLRSLAFYTPDEHGNPNPKNGSILSAASAQATHGKHEKLSHFLHASLPPQEDTERICKASSHSSVLAHEIMTMPYATLSQNGLQTHESLLEVPPANLHPVLISRHMLLLATFLQHLQPDLHNEIKDLSESPRAIMERLADLAINLVTTNDELLGSIEGLECVMIESVYQVNIGNLRRSWVANRRAMSIAQLMGIHRSDNQAQYKVLDPKTKYHPQLMWFRIVYLDRYLCLLLGLSQGSLDRSMASDAILASDTPMGRLERIHCVVASQILERNESNPSSHDLGLTRTLDVELQKAARSLPSKWWLAPKLDTSSTGSQDLFWNTRRIFAQVFHYNLLNQLHLPYMLRSSSAERKYEHSLITCVNASREVLSRFITLRSFNGIAYSCRTVDFLALMAAMTLVLAHIDSHQSEAGNLLGHQYHSDRAMIERVQENMEEVNRLNSDALSAQSADLLRRLLTIEIETADALSGCGRRVSVQKSNDEITPSNQDDDAGVSVHIPYFGIIRIARDGMSKIVKPPATTAIPHSPVQSQIPQSSRSSKTESLHAQSYMRSSPRGGSSGVPSVEAITPVYVGYDQIEAPSTMLDAYGKTQAQLSDSQMPIAGANAFATDFAPPLFQNSLSDPLLQHEEYPELAAGAEDWAFQGVDMAFFDSLMRSGWN